MKQTFLLLFSIILGQIMAQDLPRGFSASELQMVSEGHFDRPPIIPGSTRSLRSLDAPRTMAEWEELQAIVITWRSYPNILLEIVKAAQKECTVIIVTTDSTVVKSTLSANGINPEDNIEFIRASSNSVWIRDYGANPVYLREVDSLVLVDWIYNRPRPFDDVIPGHVAAHLGVPLAGLTEAPNDLVHTGGNFMVEGHGLGFSSKLILDENDATNIWGFSNHSEEDIDSLMFAYMGIEDFVKLEVLPFDGIHHIDMHMKILDEETILMGQYPEGVADGPQIEANLFYILDQFETLAGRPFRVVRIPMPPDQFGRYPDNGGFYRTYTNAMFVNNTILVPTYEEKYDSTAIRIWQETMPGYQITGINCNDIIPAGGAIHCITKEVGVDNPLWISHTRPLAPEAFTPVLVEAGIQSREGVAAASLFYSVEGSEYQELTLVPDAGKWSATIPGAPPGALIRYYFAAESGAGKSITRPLPAPEGFFELEVQQPVVAVNETEKEQIFLARPFPNPARQMTCIPLECAYPVQSTIRIRDVHGRMVLKVFEGRIDAGPSKYFFDASRLQPGMHAVEVLTGSVIRAQKVLIL